MRRMKGCLTASEWDAGLGALDLRTAAGLRDALVVVSRLASTGKLDWRRAGIVGRLLTAAKDAAKLDEEIAKVRASREALARLIRERSGAESDEYADVADGKRPAA